MGDAALHALGDAALHALGDAALHALGNAALHTLLIDARTQIAHGTQLLFHVGGRIHIEFVFQDFLFPCRRHVCVLEQEPQEADEPIFIGCLVFPQVDRDDAHQVVVSTIFFMTVQDVMLF